MRTAAPIKKKTRRQANVLALPRADKDRAELVTERLTAQLLAFGHWLFSMSIERLYLLTMGTLVLLNGAYYGPQTNFMFSISQNIYANPFAERIEDQWLLYSFLGPLLANRLGLNGSMAIFAFAILAFFLTTFFLILKIVERAKGSFEARLVLLAFSLAPVSTVVFTWLGSPDVLTLILALAAIVFSRWLWIVALCGFLLGINHLEQTLAIGVGLAAYHALSNSLRAGLHQRLPSLIALGLSALAGRWVLTNFFATHQFNIEFTRLSFISNAGWWEYLNASLGNFPLLAFSLFGALWFLLAFLWYYAQDRTPIKALLVASIIAFGIILITLDQTRVFSLVTFPVIFTLLIEQKEALFGKRPGNHFYVGIGAIVLLGLFLPRILIMGGKPYGSAYLTVLDDLRKLMGIP